MPSKREVIESLKLLNTALSTPGEAEVLVTANEILDLITWAYYQASGTGITHEEIEWLYFNAEETQ